MSRSRRLPLGRKLSWLALACIALLPAVAGAWPWSRDMANQISIKPQHGPDSIRPFPQRSVPMVGTNTLLLVHDRDAAMKLVNPNPATAESVGRGRKFFQIFCTPCHGKSGTGDGLVGAKFLIRPFDLTAENEQKVLSEGYIYGTVAFGGALMPSYGNDLSPSEVWDLVNYVRHGLVSDGLVSHSLVSNGAAGKPK
jgi:mono/diheme cytochrome c family protein